MVRRWIIIATTKSTTKGKKLSAFEEELIETVKKINEYKEACEANIVSILYKNPDSIYETNLSLECFSRYNPTVISSRELFLSNFTISLAIVQ